MKQEDFILLTYKNKGKHSGQIETLVQGKKQNPYNQIKWDQVVYTKQDYPLLYELFEKQYTPKNKYVITEKELENPIIFEDSAVKEIIVNRFGTDGEITFKQAAQVTNEQLEGLFNSNTTITKFNEFVFFTGITKVSISDDGNLAKTNSPFYNCANLQEITLPETVTDLGYRAFDGCKNITKINFNNVIKFGFCCCQNVGYAAYSVMKLPSYMEVYGSNTNVFNNAYGFELIEGDHLYIKCLNGLARMLLNCGDSSNYYKDGKPFSVTLEAETINQMAFQNCPNIVDLELVNFKNFTYKWNCTDLGLQKIIIPDTCENLGQGQTFITGGKSYTVKEIKLTTNPLCTSIPDRFTSNMGGYSELYIPDNIKTILFSAFYGVGEDDSLKKIYIGTGITSIAYDVFARSSNLEEVTIKAITPPTLHQDAFRDCNNTFKIYVPSESVEAYKTASVWSNYADRIFGIEEETN